MQFDDFLSIDEIANHLNVSNRTIRNDLDFLNTQLKNTNVTLVKTPGMGIKLDGSHTDKLTLSHLLKDEISDQFTQSAQQRRNSIILRILSNEVTEIKDLLNEFYVSRATIQKDLVKIEQLLVKYKLTLLRQRTQGIRIQDNERSIRNLMFDIMLQDETLHKLHELLIHPTQSSSGNYIFFGLDLTDDEIAHLHRIIENEIPELKYQYTPIFSTQLYVRLIIVLKRLEINQAVSLTKSFKNELMQYEGTYQTAHKLIQSLETYLRKSLPNDEISYIQAYVIAYVSGDILDNYDTEKIQTFITQLLQQWSQVLSFDFTQDAQLYDALLEHLNAVYLRVKHGIQIVNPLINDIFEQFPNTYKIVKQSIHEINDDFWKSLSNEEVGYLALYFANALERKKQPLNTLLVTDFGKGGQMLLIDKIKNHCKEIAITQSIRYHDTPSYPLDAFDLIITTKSFVPTQDKPIITIDNLLNDDDLIHLKRAVRPLYKQKNNPKPENPIK